jgi:hypothetical protein
MCNCLGAQLAKDLLDAGLVFYLLLFIFFVIHIIFLLLELFSEACVITYLYIFLARHPCGVSGKLDLETALLREISVTHYFIFSSFFCSP